MAEQSRADLEAKARREQTARERWAKIPANEREAFFVLWYADYIRLVTSRS
jgi:hypothetical protein